MIQSILEYLFGAASFVPHGYCLLWRPDLVAMHAVSDFLIGAAYLSIPVSIFAFTQRRRDLAPEHLRVAGLFGAFIVACALSHFAGLLTLWYPFYGLQGLVKVATAAISVATAIVLWPLVPKLARIPSATVLIEANRRLAEEMQARRELVDQLQRVNRDLEKRVERRTQELQDANHRFDRALTGSSITVYQQDTALRYTWVFNPLPGYSSAELMGRSDDDVLPEPTARLLSAAKKRVLATGEPERIEAALRVEEKLRWYEFRIEPLQEEGHLAGLTTVAIDISAQKEYQQHLKVVMRELTHRSKNLLAVVQGIARQTAQSVDTLPSFTERFGARLQALARAHDLLVEESWRGAAIEELISSQLGHVVERSAERITASGPRVMLKPEAAQNVALALHELSTNAAKYGALSNDQGSVRVEWGASAGQDPEPMFEITWSEAGGPPAGVPGRKGFGSIIIERLVPRAIDGSAEVSYDDGGMRWRLRFPSRFLVGADGLEEVA